jgi:hypothetical protein
VNPCLVKMAVVGVLAAAGTFAGTTLADSAPAATSSYACPQGISSSQCSYLEDLAGAGLAVPGNALNAAGIICIDLSSETAEQVATAFLGTHPGMTLGQAEQYIEITQKDMC